MKTQIRQLAKQLQTSSIAFPAAIEENQTNHHKAIISPIEWDVGGEEEEVKKLPCYRKIWKHKSTLQPKACNPHLILHCLILAS